jgi:hypothetical protein
MDREKAAGAGLSGGADNRTTLELPPYRNPTPLSG